MAFEITGLDHVQIAIPKDGEDKARAFYSGILGLKEIEKPPHLKVRGGAWFQCGSQQIHIGTVDSFLPAKKSTPGHHRSQHPRSSLSSRIVWAETAR